MAHPFLIKEIALQAGLSEATVDRVLNRRGGVRKHTAQRVKQAIRELQGQREQAGLTGRKFVIDVLMQAPDRFSEAVRVSLEDEMPTLRPAVFRARYHFSEVARIADLAALIDRIGARGTSRPIPQGPRRARNRGGGRPFRCARDSCRHARH